jgi:outer membrane protein assembly factor BamB
MYVSNRKLLTGTFTGHIVLAVLAGVMSTGYSWSDPGDVRWTYTTDIDSNPESGVDSSPAIGLDGTIYFGSDDGHLYALNQDGQLRWSFAAGGQVETPAIGDDGTIYFSCRDGDLYAVTRDGDLLWRTSVGFDTSGNQAVAAPAIGYDGTIYAAAGELLALAPDGSIKWRAGLPTPSVGAPSISPNGAIYVPTGGPWNPFEGYLCAFSVEGAPLWQRELDGALAYNSPAIDGEGNLFVGTILNSLYSFDSEGTERWSYQPIPTSTYDGNAWGSSALGETELIFHPISNYFYMTALDQDGTEVWRQSLALNATRWSDQETESSRRTVHSISKATTSGA